MQANSRTINQSIDSKQVFQDGVVPNASHCSTQMEEAGGFLEVQLALHRKFQASQGYTMRPGHCEKERLGGVRERNGVEGKREEGKGGLRHIISSKALFSYIHEGNLFDKRSSPPPFSIRTKSLFKGKKSW